MAHMLATQRKNNKIVGSFFPVQPKQLIALKQAKLINNAAYVYFALKLENPFCDRPVEVIPKEFALRWQIPEVSVYKAIAKLKEMGLLNIKAGKLVVEWADNPKSKQLSIPIEAPKAVNEPATADPWAEDEKERLSVIKASKAATEVITADPWFDSVLTSSTQDKAVAPDTTNSDYQARKKIIKFDNELSETKIDYQNRKNSGLKALSGIDFNISQTYSDDPNQPEGGGSKNVCTTTGLANNSTKGSQSEIASGKKENESEKGKVPQRVAQPKQKVVSSTSIPKELEEKLRELEIPLDNKVLTAIANHDISQAYGAIAHVESTWSTISNPKSVFLYQLPKQPVEKLGSRLPELGKQMRAENEAIEQERATEEYQQKAADMFSRIREKLNRDKSENSRQP